MELWIKLELFCNAAWYHRAKASTSSSKRHRRELPAELLEVVWEEKDFNMVSMATQPENATLETRQNNIRNLPSKTFVKETHREGNGLGTPRQSKQEGHTPSKAQDVAELKDYVREYMMDQSPYWTTE